MLNINCCFRHRCSTYRSAYLLMSASISAYFYSRLYQATYSEHASGSAAPSLDLASWTGCCFLGLAFDFTLFLSASHASCWDDYPWFCNLDPILLWDLHLPHHQHYHPNLKSSMSSWTTFGLWHHSYHLFLFCACSMSLDSGMDRAPRTCPPRGSSFSGLCLAACFSGFDFYFCALALSRPNCCREIFHLRSCWWASGQWLRHRACLRYWTLCLGRASRCRDRLSSWIVVFVRWLFALLAVPWWSFVPIHLHKSDSAWPDSAASWSAACSWPACWTQAPHTDDVHPFAPCSLPTSAPATAIPLRHGHFPPRRWSAPWPPAAHTLYFPICNFPCPNGCYIWYPSGSCGWISLSKTSVATAAALSLWYFTISILFFASLPSSSISSWPTPGAGCLLHVFHFCCVLVPFYGSVSSVARKLVLEIWLCIVFRADLHSGRFGWICLFFLGP